MYRLVKRRVLLGWRQIMLVVSAAMLCAELTETVWVGAACIFGLGSLVSALPAPIIRPRPTQHHPAVPL
jgi:hypothetical protein